MLVPFFRRLLRNTPFLIMLIVFVVLTYLSFSGSVIFVYDDIPRQTDIKYTPVSISFNGVARFIPVEPHVPQWVTDWYTKTLPDWHVDTLSMFRAYLSTGHFKTYIGFGEWVGPTALFACSYVSEIVALEPDPIAFKILSEVFKANPLCSTKGLPSNLCIADKPGELILRGAGGSGSFLESSVNHASTKK